jgi:putative membrane protein
MRWGEMDGWSWVWMASMMFAFWFGIIALFVALLRQRNRENPPPPTVQQILDEQLARGDITVEEYETRRAALRRHRPD